MIIDAITSSKDVTPIEGDVMQFRTATELLQAASEAVEARDDDELLRRLHMVSLVFVLVRRLSTFSAGFGKMTSRYDCYISA